MTKARSYVFPFAGFTRGGDESSLILVFCAFFFFKKRRAFQVAIKTYEKSKLKDAKHRRRVQQEIKIMERLSSPEVIHLFETIESPKRIHIVMEHLGGSNLCSYVKWKKRLDEDEGRQIFCQIVSSLEYVHALDIVHRDIKLEVGYTHINIYFQIGERIKRQEAKSVF